MKRKFVNPEITRIEIRLTENIAISEGVEYTPGAAFYYSHVGVGCSIYYANTNYIVAEPVPDPDATWEIWQNCLTLPQTYESVKMMLNRR